MGLFLSSYPLKSGSEFVRFFVSDKADDAGGLPPDKEKNAVRRIKDQ